MKLDGNAAALLGLLAIEDSPRPWTSYELTTQTRRSLFWFWPRAVRRLYDIPKKLVAAGYAQAHKHATGRRGSTRYTITGAGKQALRDWLELPGEPGGPKETGESGEAGEAGDSAGVLGEIEFWMSREQFEYWKHTHLTVDVVTGRGSGFSVEAPEGKRFLIRSRLMG